MDRDAAAGSEHGWACVETGLDRSKAWEWQRLGNGGELRDTHS